MKEFIKAQIITCIATFIFIGLIFFISKFAKQICTAAALGISAGYFLCEIVHAVDNKKTRKK